MALPQAAGRQTIVRISRAHDHILLACACLLVLLSGNQRSYAPKEGIHTVAHITPADILIWAVAFLVLLPVLERTRWGRIFSWLSLLGLVAAGMVLSHRGHLFVSLIHHPDSSHLKNALKSGAPLVLAAWQFLRLMVSSRSGAGGARETGDMAPLGNGKAVGNGTPAPVHSASTRRHERDIVLPPIPLEIWGLLVVAVLSGITMILPTDSLSELLHSPDAGREQIRKGGLFIIQLVQHLGIMLFLLLLTLRCASRVRLAVRCMMLTTLACVAMAFVQYVDYFRHGGKPVDVQGFLQSRNAYGGFLCLALPLALGCLLGARRRVVRVAFGILIALGLITTLSGAGFWCCLLGLLVTGFRYNQKVGIRVAAACLIAALVIPAVLRPNRQEVDFFTLRAIEKPAAGGDPQPSDSVPLKPTVKKQYVEWVAGIFMASQHFWLGVGPGQYQLNIGEYYGQDPNPAIRLETDSNNLYFVYLASLGFAGLVMLLQIFLSTLRRSWQTAAAVNLDEDDWWHGPEGRALAAGVCGSLAALLVVSLFTALMVRGIGIAIALVIALSVLMEQPSVS